MPGPPCFITNPHRPTATKHWPIISIKHVPPRASQVNYVYRWERVTPPQQALISGSLYNLKELPASWNKLLRSQLAKDCLWRHLLELSRTVTDTPSHGQLADHTFIIHKTPLAQSVSLWCRDCGTGMTRSTYDCEHGGHSIILLLHNKSADVINRRRR